MSRLIPAAERIQLAIKLIEKTREFPVPTELGNRDFSYIAQVKDLLRQARDLVKFLSMSPSTTAEMKEQIKNIYQDAEQTEKDLLTGMDA
jgi:hypothetical protein